MKFIKENPLLIALIFGLLVLILIIVSLVKLPDLPSRVSAWKYPPDVYICRTAPVEEDAVYKAVAFWEHLGFQFGMIVDDFDCIYNNDPGYENIYLYNSVIIYPAYKMIKPGDSEYGKTDLLFDTQSLETKASIIEIAETSNLTMVHELGHVLGFTHTYRVGHIMNPWYYSGGWNTEGLNPDVKLHYDPSMKEL